MVCFGNICRSPMAEVLWAQMAPQGPDVCVSSAGIGALVGHRADPIAEELMRERGLDLSAHRARQLTAEMVNDFELILVMEAAQQRAVESITPSARGRVLRIGQWSGFDVPDPYGQDRAAFEKALALIEQGLRDYHGKLGRRR
jgi:protein-tyrosine phosphatase